MAVRLRPRAAPRWPHHPLAARQGARRLQLHQRHGLRPRPSAGLRRVARARQRRLVVRGRAALLQARRGQERGADDYHGAGARSASPTCGSAERAVRGLHRRAARRPACRAPRFQRRRAGRRRLLPAHHPRRPALQHRGGLPEARAPRPNLIVVTDALVHGLVLEGRRATGVRYSARRKRDGAAAREVILSAGAIGSPQSCCSRASAPRALLKSAGVTVRRSAGRRREPAGPPAGALRVRLHGLGHLNESGTAPG